MKTIGLCMIVKNEAAVIVRCLDSVRPLVDYVLIEDTGSTDGTQQIIRDYLAREGLPGEVIEESWHDFAFNRSHVLTRLRERAEVDYALIMDADDRLVLEDGFDPAAFKNGLTADLYHVWIRLGGVRYHRPQICGNRVEFYYRGVVHEFLDGPRGFSSATAEGFYIAAGVEGARSQDPDKYRKDAEALERALNAETDPFMRSRYTFYLAQSCRDSGQKEKAVEYYLKRAELGFWDEEIFISLYQAGKLQAALDRPYEDVMSAYQRATDTVPRRAEALHGASHYCRSKGKNRLGYELAKRGLTLPEPVHGLFVEAWIYQYGLLDELAINAYWAGEYEASIEACERLLREGKIPEGQRERIRQNAKFAQNKIDQRNAPAPVAATPVASVTSEIHVINLDRTTDRLEKFQKTNKHLPNTVRFPAIDGTAPDTGMLAHPGVMAPKLQYLPGAVGAALSHIALWRMVADSGQSMTIAEDDAVFSASYAAKSDALFAGLPADWDIVFWGCEFRTFLWIELISGITVSEIRTNDRLLAKNIEQFQQADTNPILFKLRHQFGLMCYSLSPRGARALLEQCLPLQATSFNFPDFRVSIKNVGIDCAMNNAYPKMNAFVCLPPLVAPDYTMKSTIR